MKSRFTGLVVLVALVVAHASFAIAATGATGPSVEQTLPISLQPALFDALARDAGPAANIGKDRCAVAHATGLRGCFTANGATFGTENSSELGLQLKTFGRSDHQSPVASVSPKIVRNTATYSRGSLSEWWRVLPMGFEQSFTLAERPAGRGEVLLQFASSRPAQAAGESLEWGTMRYGKLVVIDSRGKEVPAKLESAGTHIVIAINDAHAVYPLTVDPLVWIQKLTASDGAQNDQFGVSVAASGTTMLVGAPYATVNGNAQQGAVYVFAEVDGVWTENQKLTANDGAASDVFGYDIALLGSSAFIGAPGAAVDGNVQGVAYVFTQVGGTWTQQQKLFASDATTGSIPDQFGLAIATTGTTAFITAPFQTINDVIAGGAVYVYSVEGGAWVQTQKLIPPDASAYTTFGSYFGLSIAASNTTLLVGAPSANLAGVCGNSTCVNVGAVWVYTNSDGVWMQSQELSASDALTDADFAVSVALDGSTAVIGADGAANNGSPFEGAAYFFTRSNGTWVQTQEVAAPDGGFGFGFGKSVAVSGATALVGSTGTTANGHSNQGTAYEFSESDGSWAFTQELTESVSDGYFNDRFGNVVGFVGTAAFVGARGESIAPSGFPSSYGAVFIYAPTLGPIVSATPNGLTFTLGSGDTGSSTLTIANTGDDSLTYAFAEATSDNSSQGTFTLLPGGNDSITNQGSVRTSNVVGPRTEGRRALNDGSDQLSFVLDNGTYDSAVTWTSSPTVEEAAIWLNRFSPPQGVGAFTINSISIMWPDNANGSLVGKQVNLVAYYDATSSGFAGNAVRLGGDNFVTITSLDTFIDYAVNFSVPGSGDIYIGFESSYASGGSSPLLFPAAIDNSEFSQERSWIAASLEGPPDVDNLHNDVALAPINYISPSSTGSWLIRGTGTGSTTIANCSNPSDVPWLSETPTNGSVAGQASQQVTVTVDAANLVPGTYSAVLCLTTNDPTNTLIPIPVSVLVSTADTIFKDGFDGP